MRGGERHHTSRARHDEGAAMRVLTGFVLCLVLLIAAGTILLYSGWYNVAATEPHTALGTWILDTAKHRSVKVQADDVQITKQFTDGQIRRENGRAAGRERGC